METKSPSIQSKLEVMAMAWEHFRVIRDSANRAEDYLSRVIKRSGTSLEDFWLEFPEPIVCMTLPELMTAVAVLCNDLNSRVSEIEQKATEIIKELKLKEKTTKILYSLSEKNRQETRDFEKKWLNRNSEDELSILDSMPDLDPDEQAELTASGWQKLGKVPKQLPVSQPKPIFSLKTRPKK